MRSAFIVLLAILAPASAFGQESAAPKNPSVSGMVVASDSGRPLAKVGLTLVSTGMTRPGASSTATTAEDGTFEISDVAPGSYSLMAERNGYVSRRESRSVITVTAGSDVRNIALRLSPAAVITGRVLNDDGEPVPYATVEALQRRGFQRGLQLLPVRSAQTNDLGEYRIFGLAPGRYLLRVTTNDRGFVATAARKRSESELAYPPIYYPDVTSQDAATPYEVGAGSEGRADFHLTRLSGVILRGRVTGLPKSDQQPARVVQVMLRSGFQQTNAAVVQEDGSFEIHAVVPGTYSLDAFAPEFVNATTEPKMRTAHRKITVTPGQNDEVVLNLEPGVSGEIRGQIRVEGTAPKFERIVIALVPTATGEDEDGMFFGRTGGGGYGNVQADGTFTIKVNGRGPYRALLTARGPGLEDFYTKSVTYAGRDVTEGGFTFGGSSTMEITVSSAGATVEGTVVDQAGKPVANSTVVAIPNGKLREHYELYETAPSDQNGHFVLRGQRPGDYSVFAWQDLHGQDYFDPDFVKRYEENATSLHAEANGRHQLVLKAIPVED